MTPRATRISRRQSWSRKQWDFSLKTNPGSSQEEVYEIAQGGYVLAVRRDMCCRKCGGPKIHCETAKRRLERAAVQRRRSGGQHAVYRRAHRAGRKDGATAGKRRR